MPQLGSSLPPPTSENPGTLRQCSTAPNLAGMLQVNRYANLDVDSPTVFGSPPHPGLLPMKFYPLPSSKYRQLSQLNLSTSPPKIHVDFGDGVNQNQPPMSPLRAREIYQINEGIEHSASLQNFDQLRGTKPLHANNRGKKPSFSVGPQDEYDSRSGCSSRSDVPTVSVHSCDSDSPSTGTPRALTPMGSPQLARKRATTPALADLERKPSGGFLGWLTRSSNPSVQPEAEFFHQKEDMSALTNRAGLIKARPKMPVSLSDINVFTPSEY